MNIAKLFIVATACFSISSVQAMGSTFNDNTHHRLVKLGHIDKDGEVSVPCPIPESELMTLQKSDILSVVPSSIEFSDEKDEFVFNILATAKLFRHVRVHDSQRFMLPAKFHDYTQNEFKKIYIPFKNICSRTLGDLNLGVKKDKIRKMVDQNMTKIIEQLGGNPELYNTADQDKEIINDLSEKLSEFTCEDNEKKSEIAKKIAEFLNGINQINQCST